MTRYVLIVLSLAGGFAAAAAPLEARSVLTPPVTPFHRPAEYTFVLEGAAEALPEVPEWRPDIKGVEIHEGGVRREALEDGRTRATFTYIIDPVQVGDYTLPPISVRDGEETKTLTPALVLRVRDLTDSEREMASRFAGIVRPEEVAPDGMGAPAWTGIILAVVAVVCGAYYFLRQGKKEAVAPPPAPWELAMRRMTELLRRHPPESGRYEAYYVDLSSILRYYIEDRFDARAPELTTPELLNAINEANLLNEEQQAFLSRFLFHCDRVKFARYRPSPEEMKSGYTSVENFIRETTPPAPAQEEEAA